MPCPSCGRESRADAAFCDGCGAPLTRACAGCGRELRPDARFCDGCGAQTGEEAQAAPERDPRSYTPKHLADKILQSKSALEGERKQVTVLFADIKSSMEAQSSIDAEDWHGIMERFFEILAEGVHRFEGTINQYTGDGIMALFGAPIAHEDHARRACYAALQLTDQLRTYANELRLRRGLSFSVRMGLNSGEVVVGKIGDDLRMDYTAQGQTVGLAARMEQLAEPGKAYLTEHTAQLVRGYFELTDLGRLEVKGIEEPMSVYELQSVGALRTRLDVSRARGFSRFVGRVDEMQILETALSRAEKGNPQIIGVVGEAGVGKSRLCAEFVERCRARGVMAYETTGVSHGKSVPLLPILALFRTFFGITDQDSDATARERIAGRLVLLDESFREALPLMFDFLGVTDPSDPTPRMDAEARQRQLFSIVRGVTRARAGRETTVTLLEDLHWFDGASEAFLDPLLDLPPGARSLAILNFRPEYQAEWMQKSTYQQVPLMPLGPEEIAELVGELLGADPSLERLPALIRERTGGNPFFVEEVVLSLAEDGIIQGEKGRYRLARPTDQVRIPPTVQGILAARIDRLAERDKQLLQTAAVVGKTFPETVLRLVAELSDPQLAEALQSLQGSEFIYEEAIYPEREYAFKHPLTQGVAYDTQLRERRVRVHAAVAKVIEGLYAEKLDEQAALLAYHCEQAGEPSKAVTWHRRAAVWAGISDPSEALRHWERVRELVGELPEDRQTFELGATACEQILTLGWRQGGFEEEAAAVFDEGTRLAERAGSLALLSRLNGAYAAHNGLNLGYMREYVGYSLEATKLADRTDDEALKFAMRSYLCFSYAFAGRSREGLELAEEMIERGPENPSFGAEIAGYSPYIGFLVARAMILLSVGRLREAAEQHQEAMRLAQIHGYPEMLTWIHSQQCLGDESRAEPAAVRSHAQAVFDVAEKAGGTLARNTAILTLGQSQLANGQPREAIASLQESLRMIGETRSGSFMTALAHSRLGEAHLALGDLAMAREHAEEGVEFIRSRALPFYVDPYLLLARVLLRTDEIDRAEGVLDELQGVMDETGTRRFLPFLHECRAELAEKRGDANARETELREAHGAFVELGAPRQAERLERQLADLHAQER
jgi:class 3 adenylate cyclase/tetratricopeptide (TPR) repeat protein